MDFKQSIQLLMETSDDHELLDITDGHAHYRDEDGYVMSFTHLPTLEDQLKKQFEDHSFCAYRSNQYGEESGEIGVLVTLNNQKSYVIEFDFWRIAEGEIDVNYNQFYKVNEEIGFETSPSEAILRRRVLTSCPEIEETILEYSKQMREYRLFYVTGRVILIHDA